MIRIFLILILLGTMVFGAGAQDRYQDAPDFPARLCNPDNPQLVNLLEEGDIQDFEDSNVIDSAIMLPILIDNANGERFLIEVHAMEPGVIEEYLQDVMICVEVLDIPEPRFPELSERSNYDPVQAYTEMIANEMGLDVRALLEMKPQYLAAGFQTVPELLDDFGVDPELAYMYAAEFGLDMELVEAPGMPLIGYGPGGPQSDSQYIQALEAEPTSVVVTIEAIDIAREYQNSEYEAALVYFIDPTYTFGSETTHYYRAKCTRSAWTGVRANYGSVREGFWRYSPYAWLGTLYSSGAYQYASSNASKYMTHDLYVRRTGVVGTRYTIYGGWYKGWGGTCG